MICPNFTWKGNAILAIFFLQLLSIFRAKVILNCPVALQMYDCLFSPSLSISKMEPRLALSVNYTNIKATWLLAWSGVF